MDSDTTSMKYDNASVSRFVPEKEKTKEWGIRLHNQITNFVASDGLYWDDSRHRAVINYERFQGIADEKHVQYLIKPHGERLKTPYVRFPLGRSRIDQVSAEYSLQPPNRHAMCVDKDSVDERENYRLKMEVRKATAEADAELEKMMGTSVDENEGMEVVDDIEQWFKTGNYKEVWAEEINDGIDYLYRVRNLQERILPALKSTLIASRAIWVVRVERGDPMPVWQDPRKVAYELGSDSDYLDNCGWFWSEEWCSLGQIINEFRDCEEFEGEQGRLFIKQLEACTKSGGGHDISEGLSSLGSSFWINRSPEHGAVIKVTRLLWQSSKKVAIKTTKRKDGKDLVVKTSAKARVRKSKGESKIIKNVDDPFQIVCIGGMKYVKFERLHNYCKDVDDPGRNPLPVCGVHVGKSDGHSTSMQDLINPIDDMHDEIMFHMRMVLGRAGGKSLLYDISQMPRQFGKDIQKLAHHMKNDGIIAVDMSKVNEENQAGMGSPFNQWKEVDFGLSEELRPLMDMRLMLESMADDITGINDRRRGEGSEYETSGNANQALARSATRTEIYLYPFNQALKRLYEFMGNMMKEVWKDGKKAAYWNPDGSQAFLKIMPDIAMHNYGFYVGSTSQDNELKQNIRSLMQNLASSAPDNPDLLLSMVKILKADYADDAERIFEKAITAMKESSAQQAEQQQQMMAAEQEAKAAEAENKNRQHAEQLANNIDIANIQVGGKLLVAETLTDQAEIKERGSVIRDGLKSSESDQAGAKDNTAESKAKSKAKAAADTMKSNTMK